MNIDYLRRAAVLFLTLVAIVDVRAGHCEDSKAFTITAASMAGLGAIDVAQTVGCVRAGTCRETNPIFKSQASSALVLGAAKATVVASTWAITSRLKRQGHPRLAWGILIGVTAVQATTVAWNSQQLRKIRR